MVSDYEMNESTCALFFLLKYHMLNPNYLQSRLNACKRAYTTRVLLVLIDVEDCERLLLEITKHCFAYSWTLVCCSSQEEMARYIETLKLFEKKTSESLQERVDEKDLKAKMTEALTHIRSINKTDANLLMQNFSSFSGIAHASKEELLLCPGMGEKKVSGGKRGKNGRVNARPREDERSSIVGNQPTDIFFVCVRCCFLFCFLFFLYFL